MSWHYLQGQEEVSSDHICWDGVQFAPLNSKTTLGAYSLPGNGTAYYQDSLFGTMYAPSTASHGKAESISSLVASPVKGSPRLGPTITSAGTSAGTEARSFGDTCAGLLAKSNLQWRGLKTPRTYALKGLPWSCRTLAPWGITLGDANWDVGNSARIILETEAGSLPTPTAHNSKEGAYPAEYTRKTPTLAAQIGGKINPDWNEWRMGWPIKWTDLKPLAMDKFRLWLDSHGRS